MTEKWTAIPGAESYSVSNKGNIRNNNTMTVKSLHKNRYGSLFGRIRIDENKKFVSVNMTQLMRNHMPPCPGPEYGLYHLDGNKCNNNVENLKWMTNTERVKHGYNHKRRRRGGGKPLSEIEKKSIDLLWKQGGYSQVEIAKHLGRVNSTISKYLSGYKNP